MSRPKAVNLDEEGVLKISWMDGTTTRHSVAQLRKDCPCAQCNVEREKMAKPGLSLRVIDGSAPTPQKAEILEFSPVGRYALAFLFNDRHSSGIYTYDFLKSTALPE